MTTLTNTVSLSLGRCNSFVRHHVMAALSALVVPPAMAAELLRLGSRGHCHISSATSRTSENQVRGGPGPPPPFAYQWQFDHLDYISTRCGFLIRLFLVRVSRVQLRHGRGV